MRAVVIHAPKDLRIDSYPDPAPAANEVRVKIAAGGICGSDLHYYHHGGFGTVRIREPMALGHEIAGVIAAVGDSVSHLEPGMRVAVNPSQPCGTCVHCREGMRNQCLDMRFMGSAMRMPHVQGGFRERVTVAASQAIPIAEQLSLGEAAMAEPLAVCLHAGKQAGPLLGKRVLVTGCGPIGALAVIAARAHGAREIVVTDVMDAVLEKAREVGADRTINVSTHADALSAYAANKGYFDVQFEASGNERAVRGGLEALKPRGILVQLGLGGGEMSLPLNMAVAKEIEIRGTFRFHEEFGLAVDLINRRKVDIKPLLTGSYGLDEATQAFEIAGDRSRSMKVQLSF
jgi:L-idonate 5-dehydrogenase